MSLAAAAEGRRKRLLITNLVSTILIGTAFGIAPTPGQFGIRRPRPSTPIKGLVLAGASTRTGSGITGTMLGGVQTASAIIGERADEIMASRATHH